MTTRVDFTVDEWESIRRTLGMVPAAVMRISSGGVMAELFALLNMYASAGMLFTTELSQALLNTPFDMSGSPPVREEANYYRMPEAETFTGEVWHTVHEATRIVTAKATLDEVGEFKSLILYLADRVARAGKEGGVLGFGGTALTAEEKALLLQIADAVGLEWSE